MIKWGKLSSTDKADILLGYKESKLSASEIANRVFEDYGYKISRGVVIGGYYRAGVKLPGSGRPPKPRKPRPPAVRRPGQRRVTSKPYKPPAAIIPKVVADIPKPPASSIKQFIDLQPGDCKWPMEYASGLDGPAMDCCGLPTKNEKSWCEYHEEKSQLKQQGPSQPTRQRRSVRTGGWV